MAMFHFRYQERGRENFGLRVIYADDIDAAKSKWKDSKPENLIKLVSIHPEGVYFQPMYSDKRYNIDPLRTLVCANCLRACCWHGEFMCDESHNAGLVRATEAQLRELGYEHEDCFMPYLRDGHDNPNEPILTRAMMEQS